MWDFPQEVIKILSIGKKYIMTFLLFIQKYLGSTCYMLVTVLEARKSVMNTYTDMTPAIWEYFRLKTKRKISHKDLYFYQ